jgi:cobaltochelatase CobN
MPLLIVFLFTALLIVPLSATAQSDITALANTTSDENGNYTFSNLPAGDYIISAAHYITAMGGCWFIGSRYISVGDGEDLTDIDVWMDFGSASEADAILNATIDPSGLTGTSSISGITLGAGKYGKGEAPKVNATVIISSYLKGDLSGDDLLTPADALIALQMAVGTREPDPVGDMNFDGIVTSLDALMILQAV